MKVQDILRRKGRQLITVSQDKSLLEASRLLKEHNIGVLLVVDAKDKPAGIISERDIVREFAARGPECATMVVQDVMITEMIIGVPDDELSYVMNVMTQQRIRHLPIIDKDELAGLISIGDVVKAQISEAETEIRYLHSYITGTPTG